VWLDRYWHWVDGRGGVVMRHLHVRLGITSRVGILFTVPWGGP
jgi:hypothetical protein